MFARITERGLISTGILAVAFAYVFRFWLADVILRTASPLIGTDRAYQYTAASSLVDAVNLTILPLGIGLICAGITIGVLRASTAPPNPQTSVDATSERPS